MLYRFWLCATADRLHSVRCRSPQTSQIEIRGGDPVWREIPIRDNLRVEPEKCWQVAVSTILDNSFDIATMDKDSGYIRTTWNEGVVVLGGNWAYKVQISIKLAAVADTSGNGRTSP